MDLALYLFIANVFLLLLFINRHFIQTLLVTYPKQINTPFTMHFNMNKICIKLKFLKHSYKV